MRVCATLLLLAAGSAPALADPCADAYAAARAAVAEQGEVAACPVYTAAVDTCADTAPVALLYNAALVCGKVPRCDLKVRFLGQALALCPAQSCAASDLARLQADHAAAKKNCRCSIAVAGTRPGGALALGGRAVGDLPKVLEVGAGPHALTVRWDGEDPVQQQVECTRPGLQQVTVKAPVAPAPKPKAPVVTAPVTPAEPGLAPWGWAAIGVGAAGVGVGVAYLIQASGHRDDRDAAFADLNQAVADRDAAAYGSALGRFDRAEDDKASANTIAVVGFAVGGAALAAGVTLLLMDDPEGPSARLMLGPDSVGVGGVF